MIGLDCTLSFDLLSASGDRVNLVVLGAIFHLSFVLVSLGHASVIIFEGCGNVINVSVSMG